MCNRSHIDLSIQQAFDWLSTVVASFLCMSRKHDTVVCNRFSSHAGTDEFRKSS